MLKNKEDCVGCYACFNACPQKCITMENDAEGFIYPVCKEKECKKCNLCVKVCPILNPVKVQNNPSAYACINKDETIRSQSSSGGLFTLIAEYVIDKKGVVFGAEFDNHFMVLHSYVDKKQNLEGFRGSKYVQSKVGNTYKETEYFLKQGIEVLYSGTPCQIAGLKSYLGQDYDNLLCVDIICHGVPSPLVLQKYIAYQEKIFSSSPLRISFRQKTKGWENFSISILFENDLKYEEIHKNDPFMKAFLKNLCLRPSCYSCNFKTLHRQSDITLADFWGIKNLLPSMDDDRGTSLIFINNNKGELIFNKIKERTIHKAVDINKAIAYNPPATKSVKYAPKRKIFFKNLEKVPFDRLVEKCTYVELNSKLFNLTYKKLRKLNII